MSAHLYGGKGKRPIHTSHGNDWFRSKLEAQWAVVFGKLGLTWIHEPRWLFNGSKYFKPDFFIEDWDCYVEIKPRPPIFSEKLRKVVLNHSRRHRDFTCLIIAGSPGDESYGVSFFRKGHPKHDTKEWLLGDDANGEFFLTRPEEPAIPLRRGSRILRRGIPSRWKSMSSRLRLALSNGQIGPPLARHGRFIHPKSDCPVCKSARAWLRNHLGVLTPTARQMREVQRALFSE